MGVYFAACELPGALDRPPESQTVRFIAYGTFRSSRSHPRAHPMASRRQRIADIAALKPCIGSVVRIIPTPVWLWLSLGDQHALGYVAVGVGIGDGAAFVSHRIDHFLHHRASAAIVQEEIDQLLFGFGHRGFRSIHFGSHRGKGFSHANSGVSSFTPIWAKMLIAMSRSPSFQLIKFRRLPQSGHGRFVAPIAFQPQPLQSMAMPA